MINQNIYLKKNLIMIKQFNLKSPILTLFLRHFKNIKIIDYFIYKNNN